MKIIVMGPPGSGKSTQAELLAKKLKLPHLQTGELYRSLVKKNSLLGRKVRELLKKGRLVPDDDHHKILWQELQKKKYQKGFVLDGSPRTLNQAETQSFTVDKVFYLSVSDRENLKRLAKRAREDDTPKVIGERLKIYHQETEPILIYFRQKGILEEVDGEQSIEEIYREIGERLKR